MADQVLTIVNFSPGHAGAAGRRGEREGGDQTDDHGREEETLPLDEGGPEQGANRGRDGGLQTQEKTNGGPNGRLPQEIASCDNTAMPLIIILCATHFNYAVYVSDVHYYINK